MIQRPEFKTAVFLEGVETLADLKPDMILEGVVTNVTNFGAFIDVGVHQDGLVHISQMAEKFVKDPREVVKTGDVVKVKVAQVDLERKRIGLTMRLSAPVSPEERGEQRPPQPAKAVRPARNNQPGKSRNSAPKPAARRNQQPPRNEPSGAMAEALARAGLKR